MPKRTRKEELPKSGPDERKNATPTKSRWASITSSTFAHRALQLVLLAAVYSPISWLSLTPVYGSVPSAFYHHQGKVCAVLVGFLARKQLRKILPSDIDRWLPSFAFWIPTIQFGLLRHSAFLGLPYGPLVTQIFTYYPLTTLSVFTAVEYVQRVDLGGDRSAILEHGAIIVTYVAFTLVERMARGVLLRHIGSNIILSRIGLQLVAGITYAVVIPNAFWWPALPSIAFTMAYNVHTPLQRTTDLLNSTLQLHNFTLIDRQESLTGYISVLDNTASQYRIMRCDHSLLGGEWRFVPGQKGTKPRNGVQEPIYAIFAMLEAVRLVETPSGVPRRPDSESTALNIGLGIGTAPSGLIAHGIDTTVVELDPVVHDFALKYFNLPTNHTPVIGDAVQFVELGRRSGKSSKKYDYIIHDVFTGGAEPVELFTEEFLSGLKFLLKEDGVVAVNYAGDLSLPAATHVITTILSVFQSNCRIFRETVPEAPSSASEETSSQQKGMEARGVKEEGEEDFTNLIIYCLNPDPATASSNTQPRPSFRRPSESDLLNSGARQQFLFPRPELEVPIARFTDGSRPNHNSEPGSGSTSEPKKQKVTKAKQGSGGVVLKRGQTKQVEKWQKRSAAGHWRIMRTVIPDAVWENW